MLSTSAVLLVLVLTSGSSACPAPSPLYSAQQDSERRGCCWNPAQIWIHSSRAGPSLPACTLSSREKSWCKDSGVGVAAKGTASLRTWSCTPRVGQGSLPFRHQPLPAVVFSARLGLGCGDAVHSCWLLHSLLPLPSACPSTPCVLAGKVPGTSDHQGKEIKQPHKGGPGQGQECLLHMAWAREHRWWKAGTNG